MNKKEKLDFATDYIRFLIETQAGVDELYASLCYGGVVYENTRIDLYDVFGKENLLSLNLNEVVSECSSDIGDIMEYLEDRSEDECIREGEEVICYIQMPADIWDALYGETNGETADYLTEQFEEFLDNRDMEYELTTYGRNAVLIDKKQPEEAVAKPENVEHRPEKKGGVSFEDI